MREERQIGRIKEIVCQDFGEAQTRAGQEAANTAGFPLPVVIYRQGTRYSLSGALPFSFVATRLENRSAMPKGTIRQTYDAMNRPEDPGHSEAIAKYIVENRRDRYILPPLTLNVLQEARLYTADSESQLKTGFLVIPATAKLAITDGQHRRSGIVRAIHMLPLEEAQELESDGIGVMITCETEIAQIHQDFADCSKTKPLPPSQVAVYDRRNPANRLVIDLEKECPLFRGKIDATSKTLSKRAVTLFLANQLRQFVKVMLTGSWQMADRDFERHAHRLLEENPGTYQQELNKFIEYVNYLTQEIPVWKQIASLEYGVQTNQIPTLRAQGYVCLSVTGLIILGRIGHELFVQRGKNWRVFAERLGKINWRKDAEIWRGNIVAGDRIINQQRFLREAIKNVHQAINWDFGSEPEIEVAGAGKNTATGS